MNTANSEFSIDSRIIGHSKPTYFIADIAANHDGSLDRAKELIYMAKEAGADAAKFQHFRAESIVSDQGFKALGNQKSHQSKWNKSVYDVYKDATVSLDWTASLKETCDAANITFFTSPYDFDLVDQVDPYVPAYKIGSGDITWLEIIRHIAGKGKPYLIATGASSLQEVQNAMDVALSINRNVCLMQCNTNYTASLENFKYINLNVLKTYQVMYPNVVMGLSDHTPGHATVLGAIALGARVIEKHFTDDIDRAGPDHAFSMNPKAWSEMVARSRELENALGSGNKRVEENELETVILQRRALRASKKLTQGSILSREDLIPLRPCPVDAIAPYHVNSVVGKILREDINEGDLVTWKILE